MHHQQTSLIHRIRHPDILPLEISDVRVDGATLWDWSHDPGFATVLRLALEGWHDDDRLRRWNEPAPEGVLGFDAVFLTGGRTADPLVRMELSRLPCAVLFGEEPLFAGERGGFELLRARDLPGWVADLGKSQLKLSAPGWRWNFPRDWTRLRSSCQVSPQEIPAQRRRLREFLALKFQTALVESSVRPQALVFALPSRLDDEGTPGISSYAGMQGDRTLLRDAADLAGLPGLPLFVLNDAELAALGARLDARLNGFGKVLVLTLGFGIGAALIHSTG
jgi:hypothetical protein